jgi:hypothetical protein
VLYEGKDACGDTLETKMASSHRVELGGLQLILILVSYA